MRSNSFVVGLCVLAIACSTRALAESKSLDSALKAMGYVSLPITQDAGGRLRVEGKIHGETYSFAIDLTNADAVFDIRALRKLAIEFEDTGIVIPTPKKNVHLMKSQVAGIEFASVSTGAVSIYAGDIDAIYRVAPGKDGPDGVLGIGFLGRYGGWLDLERKMLHLKLR